MSSLTLDRPLRDQVGLQEVQALLALERSPIRVRSSIMPCNRRMLEFNEASRGSLPDDMRESNE